MIRVRGFEERDRPELMRLIGAQSQAHEFAYSFPDPADPTTLGTLVAEEEGRVVMVLAARTMAEGFLTLDPTWRGAPERWEAIRQLYRDGNLLAEAAGCKEIVGCFPPHLHSYARRLVRELGFVRDPRERLMLSLTRPSAREERP
jgi:hypothetical protein